MSVVVNTVHVIFNVCNKHQWRMVLTEPIWQNVSVQYELSLFHNTWMYGLAKPHQIFVAKMHLSPKKRGIC